MNRVNKILISILWVSFCLMFWIPNHYFGLYPPNRVMWWDLTREELRAIYFVHKYGTIMAFSEIIGILGICFLLAYLLYYINQKCLKNENPSP